MRRAARFRTWHIRSSVGYFVGKVGEDFVWSKFMYWGQRFSNADEARKLVRENMGRLAGCFDTLRVVRVGRRVKRPRVRMTPTTATQAESEQGSADSRRRQGVSERGHPWGDFLEARARCLKWLRDEQGNTPDQICEKMRMDPTQVQLILMHVDDADSGAGQRGEGSK